MKNINNLFYFLMLVLVLSCNSNDDNSVPACDASVILSNFQFINADTNIFDINSVTLSGDCLIANISASGCDGASWVLKLIDSEDILESDPPQRNLRLTFLNQEACLAFITTEISFDISDLQVDGGQVQLNLVNTSESLLYSY